RFDDVVGCGDVACRNRRESGQMVPAYVLFLREGLEASLIVSILLASLRQLGQMHHARAVWSGVVLAIAGAAAGGTIIFFTVRKYEETAFQIAFEAITYLVAVAVLTTVTFWMQRHSRTLKREITAQATAAGSGFALGLLAFTTVGREAVESAFFTLAFAFQTNGLLLLLGAALGILASVGLCFLIYRMGYRLDYRLFFRVMGVLLLFFAAAARQRRPEHAAAGVDAPWHDDAVGYIAHPLGGESRRRPPARHPRL